MSQIHLQEKTGELLKDLRPGCGAEDVHIYFALIYSIYARIAACIAFAGGVHSQQVPDIEVCLEISACLEHSRK